MTDQQVTDDQTAQQPPLSFPLPEPPTIYHPCAEYAGLRAERPVAQVRLPDGSLAWLATRYADVRQVLSDQRFSRAAAAGPDWPTQDLGSLATESLIGMDPPVHTRLRRLVARVFTVRRVEQLRPWVAGLVAELIDQMLAQPRPVDLARHFSTVLPTQVISELMGVPEAERENCRQWSDVMVVGDWQRDPEGVQAALDGYQAMIAAKRQAPGDDLISALIAAHDEGDRLTERELLLVTVGIFIGGHETTANMINLFLLTLLRHPEQLARLRTDPDTIPAAVEELLRFLQLGDTGVLLPRVTTDEVELSGVRIPAGSAILPAIISANRDASVFADPDRLDLTRSANPHLGFGAGVHLCLGAHLARMELQEALRGLLIRLPDLRLAVPESQLRFKPGLVVRSLETLPVAWTDPTDQP